jgi:methyltransferase-like protein 6
MVYVYLCRHDEAQLRFSKTAKLGENFYVRQDGTCSYFFTEEELSGLAGSTGLEVEECYAIRRQYANRQQKKMRRRVWMHAKLRKQVAVPASALPAP